MVLDQVPHFRNLWPRPQSTSGRVVPVWAWFPASVISGLLAKMTGGLELRFDCA